MRDSVEPKDRTYVKEYGFLYFSKSMGKNLNNKYSQKRLDSAKKFGTDPIKLFQNESFKNQQKQLFI